MRNLLLILIMIALSLTSSFSQNQTVKGTVKDAQSEYPLLGATVMVIGSDPVIGAITDLAGNFSLKDVPVGRQSIAIKFVGYKSLTLPNVLVTAGKEVILTIKLEESVETLEEIVISTDANKDLPINELAKVSARTFSLEEVNRFSGGRNDVSRLVANFAGVSTPDDSRNDIVVRGNSPVGLLWRINGIPIATTNHFATLGTTGGPVSALNTNLLRTSDFISGAFPAEYGNANAAVFDVNFREGNKDIYEYTGQVAFNGVEFMAEGPLSRKNNASFVASYRYGIAGVAATGTSSVPYFQDFSFNMDLGKSKLGRFKLFGFGGLSSIDFLGDDIDENDLFANPNEDAFVENELGLIGLSHNIRLNKNTYLQSAIGYSINGNEYIQDNLIRNEAGETITRYRATEADNRDDRFSFSTQLNKKYSARFSLRAGYLVELFNLKGTVLDRDNRPDSEIPDSDNDEVPDFFLTVRAVDRNFTLNQPYVQGEYKFSDDLSITGGLHAQYLSINDDFVLEPRFGASWQFQSSQRISFAYGLHSQMVPLPVLFLREQQEDGSFLETNLDLDFMKSHHFVVGYDKQLGNDWRLKAEAYYQSLFDIPVEMNDSSSYSVINEGGDFIFDERGSLVNEGLGFNYGLEVTLEKFFSRGYYALLTASLFESKYEGQDGITRNTAFNNNYVFNLLMGREWKIGAAQRNAITFDTRLTAAGGRPYTPINEEETRLNNGDEVLMEEIAYSNRLNPYIRWDVKFGFRLNAKSKKVSHQFYVDFQNVLDRENQFTRRFNEVTQEVNVVDQIGFFPDILYRIQF
ncbi:MAG TPA: carboxypeptidase-like regulatory domain-containing protein [Cyclobacteriaceae bacterium]